LESLGLTDFWARPTATSLSQWMTVGGCGYPNCKHNCWCNARLNVYHECCVYNYEG
jgi:hypothetical protein